MNVNLSNAVRMFYGKSSYEMVYMEAIANALDAKATELYDSSANGDFKAMVERLEILPKGDVPKDAGEIEENKK